MALMREIIPCRYEDSCLSIENNPLKCKDCELYKAKIPMPKLAPVVLNFSDYLIFFRKNQI